VKNKKKLRKVSKNKVRRKTRKIKGKAIII